MTDPILVKTVERLLTSVVPNGECLDCHLAPIPSGYCYVQPHGRSGRKWRVNRLVWHVLRGDIPDNTIVMHKCDNPRCININHLQLGSFSDNTQDMMQKGRNSNGNGLHDKVRKAATGRRIKLLTGKGFTKQEIADQLFISLSTVNNYTLTNGVYHEYFRN